MAASRVELKYTTHRAQLKDMGIGIGFGDKDEIQAPKFRFIEASYKFLNTRTKNPSRWHCNQTETRDASYNDKSAKITHQSLWPLPNTSYINCKIKIWGSKRNSTRNGDRNGVSKVRGKTYERVTYLTVRNCLFARKSSKPRMPGFLVSRRSHCRGFNRSDLPSWIRSLISTLPLEYDVICERKQTW